MVYLFVYLFIIFLAFNNHQIIPLSFPVFINNLRATVNTSFYLTLSEAQPFHPPLSPLIPSVILFLPFPFTPFLLLLSYSSPFFPFPFPLPGHPTLSSRDTRYPDAQVPKHPLSVRSRSDASLIRTPFIRTPSVIRLPQASGHPIHPDTRSSGLISHVKIRSERVS